MSVTEISEAAAPRTYRNIGIAALVTGLLTAPAQSLVDNLNLLRGLGGLSMAIGGVPFAVLLILMVRVVARVEWWRAIVFGLIVIFAFVVSAVAAEISMESTGLHEVVRNLVGGLAGGFFGALVLMLGAMLLNIGPRRVSAWLPMIGAGTVVGLLLAFDFYRHADNFWFMFPVWQVVVALLFARALGVVKVS